MKKLFIILMCLAGLFVSCKQDESRAWDADGIRYESGKSISSLSKYERTKGTTGIIGTFAEKAGSSVKGWEFFDSTKNEASFDYTYLSNTQNIHHTGTYKIYVGDDGYFVIELSYKGGSFYKYRYYADENYLIMQE